MSTISYARWLTFELNHNNKHRDETEFRKELPIEKAGKA